MDTKRISLLAGALLAVTFGPASLLGTFLR